MGYGLGWVYHFARYVSFCWHGCFRHWKQRFAGFPVPHVEQTIFATSSNSLNNFTFFVCNIKQQRSRDMIPIPKIVMHRLKVPGQFAAIDMQRNGGVGKKICTDSCRAIVIWRRITCIHVNQTKLGIDCRRGPYTTTSTLTDSPGIPGNFPTGIAGYLRYRVEYPFHRPGNCIDTNNQAARNMTFRKCGSNIHFAFMHRGRSR